MQPKPNTSMPSSQCMFCLGASSSLRGTYRYTACPGVTYNDNSNFETETCVSGQGQSGTSSPFMLIAGSLAALLPAPADRRLSPQHTSCIAVDFGPCATAHRMPVSWG